MRVAVVTSTFGETGLEEQLITRRIAGAIACHASVSILVAEGIAFQEEVRGSFTVRHFPSTQAKPRSREILLNASLGTGEPLDFHCSCARKVTDELAATLPHVIQEELIRLEGGHSPELYEHLRTEKFDVVVFADYRKACTYFGLQEVLGNSRIVLIPLARQEPPLSLSIYDSVFLGADRILTVTEAERSLISRRLAEKDSNRVVNVGFVLRVNRLSSETEPANFRKKKYVVAATESLTPQELSRMQSLASLMAREFDGVCLSLVGRNAAGRPPLPWLEAHQVLARSDLWRWANRAVALLDPKPHQLLAPDSLEAMLCGCPTVVSEVGGAAREHAETGNGGLWFSNNSELCACIETLLSGSIRDELGVQGKKYAQNLYGNTDHFIRQVAEAVLG